MRILHTGDWHLGKVLRGRPRLDEQRAVLAELIGLIDRERVDLLLVAGDVFDAAAPTPEAQALAFQTLLAARAAGAEVVVIAGNHDHPGTFEALSPLFAAAGVTMRGAVARPDQGGRARVRRSAARPLASGCSHGSRRARCSRRAAARTRRR